MEWLDWLHVANELNQKHRHRQYHYYAFEIYLPTQNHQCWLNPNDKYHEISKGTINTYKKTELHENSVSDFKNLMRNQTISGNSMSLEDLHSKTSEILKEILSKMIIDKQNYKPAVK